MRVSLVGWHCLSGWRVLVRDSKVMSYLNIKASRTCSYDLSLSLSLFTFPSPLLSTRHCCSALSSSPIQPLLFSLSISPPTCHHGNLTGRNCLCVCASVASCSISHTKPPTLLSLLLVSFSQPSSQLSLSTLLHSLTVFSHSHIWLRFLFSHSLSLSSHPHTHFPVSVPTHQSCTLDHGVITLSGCHACASAGEWVVRGRSTERHKGRHESTHATAPIKPPIGKAVPCSEATIVRLLGCFLCRRERKERREETDERRERGKWGEGYRAK